MSAHANRYEALSGILALDRLLVASRGKMNKYDVMCGLPQFVSYVTCLLDMVTSVCQSRPRIVEHPFG